MKLSRTILPALAMLVIATVMLSTASFAWFAISSQATVNGMSVSVRSDSAFLVVANSSAEITGNVNYSAYDVTVTDGAKKSLAPVAFDSTKMPTSGSPLTAAVNDKIIAGGNSDIWYTMTGTSDTDGTGVGSQKWIANSSLLAVAGNSHTGYLAKYTVWVSVAPKTGMTMTGLKATLVIPDGGDLSISALVVGPEGYTHLTNGEDGNKKTIAGAEVLLGTVTTTPVQVDIYIYYNGNHENITSSQYFQNKIYDTVASIQFTAGANN